MECDEPLNTAFDLLECMWMSRRKLGDRPQNDVDTVRASNGDPMNAAVVVE